MEPNNEVGPGRFISRWGLQSRGRQGERGHWWERIRNTLEHIIIILAASFLSKEPLAGFTFELFTTFSQIIHPFQDFRIRSLVTM